MNAKQKVARLVGAAMLGFTALFPPWQFTIEKAGVKQSSAAGYHPLWNPPTTGVDVGNGDANAYHRIDVFRLGIQLGTILLMVNGAVFLVKTKDRPPTER